jgi:uncharacterized membrane protein YphA (DoxX/SURF4 family)
MGLFRLLDLLFVGHGTQKLFGWFGGGGLDGTGGFFEQLAFDRGAATRWPPVPPKPVADFSSPSAPPRRSARRRSRAR